MNYKSCLVLVLIIAFFVRSTAFAAHGLTFELGKRPRLVVPQTSLQHSVQLADPMTVRYQEADSHLALPASRQGFGGSARQGGGAGATTLLIIGGVLTIVSLGLGIALAVVEAQNDE